MTAPDDHDPATEPVRRRDRGLDNCQTTTTQPPNPCDDEIVDQDNCQTTTTQPPNPCDDEIVDRDRQTTTQPPNPCDDRSWTGQLSDNDDDATGTTTDDDSSPDSDGSPGVSR